MKEKPVAARKVHARMCDDGHMELLEPVDIPANIPFEITIDLPDRPGNTALSLRGRFPQLRSISDGDFLEAKQSWEKGTFGQLETLRGRG